MEDILRQYGLLAVFAGTYLEGDVTVLLAGVMSHLHLLHYAAVLPVAFAAGVLRDLTCYFLGRSSRRARESRVYAQAEAAIERVAGRLGPAQILVAPFVYGVRTATMIFWGVRGLPLPLFAALDAAACALWATALSGAGYLLSDRAASLVGEVKEVERWLLAALVLALAAALLRRLVTARAVRREVEGNPPPRRG